MVDKLNYETPPPAIKLPVSPLTKAFATTGVVHFLVFFVYSATLDGGVLATGCFIISIAYWLVVGLILLRRRRSLTRLDLLFIAFGYLVMLLAGLSFGPQGSRSFDWNRFGGW